MKVKLRHDRVKRLRLEKQWTQEELAEIANLHPRTVQRIEREGLAALSTQHRLARALDVEPEALEFRSDRIDFGPLMMEARVLMLAISRRLLPMNDREFPNSFIALLMLLFFSASYTLMNVVLMSLRYTQEANMNLTGQISLLMGLAFSVFFLAVVIPLFKLKPWARSAMLGICLVFYLINTILLLQHGVAWFRTDAPFPFEFVVNLLVTHWIFTTLNRIDIRRLFSTPLGTAASNL